MNQPSRLVKDDIELPLSKNGHKLYPAAFPHIISKADPAPEPKKISVEMQDLAWALFLNDPNDKKV